MTVQTPEEAALASLRLLQEALAAEGIKSTINWPGHEENGT